MPQIRILKEEAVAGSIDQGIKDIKWLEQKNIGEIEKELEKRTGIAHRTLMDWKNPEKIPATIRHADAFFGLVWLLLVQGNQDLEWLTKLLNGTDASLEYMGGPDTPLEEWLYRCLSRAEVDNHALAEQEIRENILRLVNQSEQSPSPLETEIAPPLQAIETNVVPNLSIPKVVRVILLVVLILVIAIAALIVLTNGGSENPSSKVLATNLPCQPVVGNTNSAFNRAEGYHHYAFIEDSSSVLNPRVRSIGINESGVWIGYKPDENGADGVSFYDGTAWRHCPGLVLADRQNVNSIAFGEDGTIFAGIDGLGIAYIDSEGWHTYTTEHGLPSNAIYQLLVDKDGVLWAATYEGVAKLIDQHWIPVYQAETENETLTSGHIYQFLDDKQGNRWFGSLRQGIARLTPEGDWLQYYLDSGDLSNIRGIAVDEENSVWFATDGGVLKFSNDQWLPINLPGNYVKDIAVDKFNRVWVATDIGLVYTPDSGQTWITQVIGDILDIAIGCQQAGCKSPYSDQHIWFAMEGQGIGHFRLPPERQVVEVVSVTERPQLKPCESFVFKIEVRVLSESLRKSNADALYSSDPDGTDLYGAWPNIAVEDEVEQGHNYIFTNINNPLKAPKVAGVYRLSWRVWQDKRFVSDSIVVEFEVVGDDMQLCD